MAKKLRVVLDTNIIVSAIVYRGKPRQVLDLALEENIEAIISPVLISELSEILTKKFSLSPAEVNLNEQEIKEIFEFVLPTKTLHIQKDEDDNRVLEAAVQGDCKYIVTGDRELLKLGVFRNIQIVTPDEFLTIHKG